MAGEVVTVKWFVIIVILLAVAAAGFYFIRVRSVPSSPERDAAKGVLPQARADLKTAQKARATAVKQATSGLNSAQKAYDSALAAARNDLAALTDPKGRKLGSYRGVTVYERWIDTPHGSGPVAGTTASVDAQISSRITATRLLAVGVFALAAKKKTGTVFLSIDNPHVASIIECPVDDNARARSFAVTLMNAGRQAAAIEAARPAQIESARHRIATAELNTAALEQARGELSDVENDVTLLAAIESAEARLVTGTAALEQLGHAHVAVPGAPETSG